ncbi:hypothetical protein O181_063411 [Austropuccinia psidii MF-1]|uniref:Uncharacterized protein n=1 Tax=Austropuccinia psidii MF-1 TaxID=1389203 RepID=A0A9Q3EJZ9_9BASI|nr:hypothetical protein [Austropuccinia psidii MF-1]
MMASIIKGNKTLFNYFTSSSFWSEYLAQWEDNNQIGHGLSTLCKSHSYSLPKQANQQVHVGLADSSAAVDRLNNEPPTKHYKNLPRRRHSPFDSSIHPSIWLDIISFCSFVILGIIPIIRIVIVLDSNSAVPQSIMLKIVSLSRLLKSSALHSIPSSHSFDRSIATQTWLSRTDFENKTIDSNEESRKRGLATGSKKKSVLINQVFKNQNKKKSTKPINHLKVTRKSSASKPVEPIIVPEPLISSPAPIVARATNQINDHPPQPKKIETGSSSAALASPLTTSKSTGYHAKTWPASVTLPKTPIQEPLGTAIPFIPNNYLSHQNSYAPDLTNLKSSSVGLEFSTVCHPSTLPEGGPVLAALHQNPPTPSSSNLHSGLQKILSDLKSISSISFNWPSIISDQERFKFEDRPLNETERKGIYSLVALLTGSWLCAGILKP